MVIKSINDKTSGKVKFISYTGDWPNLCSGVLTLEIDGVQYKFGHNYEHMHWHDDVNTWVHEDEDPDNPNYPSFWSSGGKVTSGSPDWNFNVEHGEWIIREEDLDPKFWDYVAEIDKVLNSGVIPFGCCGGCI